MVLALKLGITYIGFAVLTPVFGLEKMSETRDTGMRECRTYGRLPILGHAG